jgi:hypothetical protein
VTARIRWRRTPRLLQKIKRGRRRGDTEVEVGIAMRSGTDTDTDGTDPHLERKATGTGDTVRHQGWAKDESGDDHHPETETEM